MMTSGAVAQRIQRSPPRAVPAGTIKWEQIIDCASAGTPPVPADKDARTA